MPWVMFLEQCDVEAQGAVAETFKMGRAYDLPPASAERWTRRGKAVYCDKPEGKAPPKPKAKPKAKAKAKAKAKSLTDYKLPPKSSNRFGDEGPK